MANTGGARSLPKQVWELGWISFFNDVCSEMAYPILALFMAALGQSPLFLGLVEGVAEFILSCMKGLSGLHSDLVGKRVPYVQWGYILSTISKIPIALAGGWTLVLTGRSLDRFGKGVRNTARDTLLVESVEQPRLGAAFGLQRGMDTAGAFVGVLATLALLYFLPGNGSLGVYRTVFLISVIPGTFAVVLTFRLRDPAHPEDKPVQRISLKALPAGYWRAVIATTVFALANSSDTFLILRAKDVFSAANWAMAGALAIWGYALYNAIYAVVSYPAGEMSDRIGRWWILGAGWFIYAAVYAGFAFTGPVLIWVLFAAYGVYIGMTDGVSKALVGEFSPKAGKATAMGLYAMVTGFAALAASALMGYLWVKCGARDAFLVSAALALASVVLAAVFGFSRPGPGLAKA